MSLMIAAGVCAQDPRTREVGVMRAKPVASTAVQKSGAPYEFGHYHALLIGVQSYSGHESDLKTPKKDATELGEVLVERYGFNEPRVLLDEQATRAGILGALDFYARNLDESDCLLIFFAGHGTLKWRGREKDEMGFWVPYQQPDAEHEWWTWVSSLTIAKALRRIQARHVLLISDSCYSGKLLTRSAQPVTGSDVASWIVQEHESGSNAVFTSGALEAVADGGRDGHSIFAYHLIDALRHNDEDFLPASRLASYVKQSVMSDADFHQGRASQQPLFGGNPYASSAGSGQFIFVRDGDAAPSGRSIEAVAGLPAGYRAPNHVIIEEPEAGKFTYWSTEGGVRAEMLLVESGAVTIDGELVQMEPFLIDRYEVTNERLERWLDAGGEVGARLRSSRRDDGDRPATAISLAEARRFAEWAGGKRLPTIEEWQYAVAFDPATKSLAAFPWGDRDLVPPLPPVASPPAVSGDGRDVSAAFGVVGAGGGVREFCELDAASFRRGEGKGAVCGGTQVREGRFGTVKSRVDQVVRIGPEYRQEKSVGFRCVKSLVPLYRPR